MKRILISTLAILTLFSLSVQASSFTDIDGHPYELAVEYIAELDIVQGYEDGSYGVDNKINRAEFTKIVLESNNIDVSDELNKCFPDVIDGWFAKYVCKAKEMEIINGYDDGFFRPDEKINFVEALKIIELAYGAELEESDPWYQTYLDEADDKNLDPYDVTSNDAVITRGQMADIMTRYLTYVDGTQEEYLADADFDSYLGSSTATDLVGGITWTIDEGMRIDYASNPRILDYSDGVITLIYESHATELSNFPSADAPTAISEDGLDFEDGLWEKTSNTKSLGVYVEDLDKWVRYSADQELENFNSANADSYYGDYEESDESLYDITDNEDHGDWIGVWTFYTDDNGDPVILFNNDNGDDVSHALISRIHSEDGETFTLTDLDFIGTPNEDPYLGGFRDPHAIRLSDGRIRMVTMVPNSHLVPPAGRLGNIYTLISEDGGETFEVEALVASYDDFEEWEVWSLNDPKIVELDDGTCRVYFAAMVPDESEDAAADFKWIMVSATSD